MSRSSVPGFSVSVSKFMLGVRLEIHLSAPTLPICETCHTDTVSSVALFANIGTLADHVRSANLNILNEWESFWTCLWVVSLPV